MNELAEINKYKELGVVYQYFTLEQWKKMAEAILKNTTIDVVDKREILSKFPSASL